MKNILLPVLLVFVVACNNNTETKDTPPADAAPAPVAVADSTKLNGNWQLNYVAGLAVPFDSIYNARKPYIRFDLAAGRFTGNTGCNNFSGELELSGNAISFLKPMIMTKMFCQGDAEPLFVQNLQKVNSWAISGDTVLHFKASGEDVMRFAKSPTDSLGVARLH